MSTNHSQLNAGFRNRVSQTAAFTLVELILVMAVMITLLAFIAPTLEHSFKQRALDQEALRLLALTEYARDEAVSQGMPTQVWIDPVKGNYGAEAMPGYDADKGDTGIATTQGTPDTGVRAKQYSLPDDVHFDTAKSTRLTAEGYVQVIQFDPDGAPTASTGINYIRITNKDNGSALLTLSTDGWGYEITKEDPNASQGH